MAKRPKVTQADVDAAHDALIAALEHSRDVREQMRAGKVTLAAIRPANLAVEEAEADYLLLTRTLGEFNVEQAGEILGAEVIWGART